MSLFEKILNLNRFFFKSLHTLNRLLDKYKREYLLGFVFIILANLMTVIGTEYVRKAINSVANFDHNFSWKERLMYSAIVVLAPIMSGLFTYFMRQTIIIASRKIEFDLKNEIFEHYERLPQSFYKKNRTGDLIARISEDVAQVRMYLGPGIMYTLNLLVITVLVSYRMVAIDATMSLYVLIPLPILLFLVYRNSKIINQKSKVVQEQLSNISSFVQDTFSGIRVIKSYNMEPKIIADYEKETSKYKEKNIEVAQVNAFFYPTILLILGLCYLFILYVGGSRYASGEIKNIGTVAAFFIYINIIVWPFIAVGWVTSVVQRAEASQKRINEFLETKPEIVNENPNHSEIKGNIEFKNVSFNYQNTGIQALKDVSFKIEAGKTLAILGRTGSGKTTIAELICRMYDADSGEILIDNQSIKKVNLYDLRRNIGYVPQESFLFSDTIKNNIAFGVDNVTDEMIINAAKDASVHDNIMHFAEQYETILGERGVTLSGGQKQRISIARVFIKKPTIYIFDDSLSAVDTETEEQILNNLAKNTQNATTLIITHRISSAKNADYIIVLDEGSIIEEGTHDALITQEGYYQTLYNQQLAEGV